MTTSMQGKGRRARPKAAAAERRRVTAELRAFAHPLRLRLYELFAEQPRTTMQVAEILGEPPTRLYHHVNALEKAGLLRLRETRPIRGTVEKYFEVVRLADATASPEVFESSPAARQSARAVASVVLEQARHDLLEERRDLKALGDAGPILVRAVIGTTPAKAARIRAQVLEFVERLKATYGAEPDRLGARATAPATASRRAKPGAKGEGRWSLTIAFAPSSGPSDPQRED